jgi:hypothetical protein
MQISAPSNVMPLSCKGQWQNKIRNTDNKYRNDAIKDLSYEIMSKFENKIGKEKRWSTWEQCIQREFKVLGIIDKMTPRLFVKTMIDRGFRIQNLLNMAEKMDDLSVKKCFYKDVQYLKFVDQEGPRILASNDISNGFLKDISDDTLIQIAELIEASPSWREMGDGLGFNLSECIAFSRAYSMLKKWLLKFPNGTLKRIAYEAQKLNLPNVCECLDAIPLRKFSPIEIRDPHASQPELRMTTVFDLEKLDKIYEAHGVHILWDVISHTIFDCDDSSKEDIWLSGNVQLQLLNKAINIHIFHLVECFDQFMEDVRTGGFEPTSPEGVTYNQIAYLAEAISSDVSLSQKSIYNELISKKIGTCDFRVNNLPVRNLLCLYWQLNGEMTLSQFVQKTRDELLPAAFQAANALLKGYNQINPKRYYSARLDQENKKNENFLRV